MIANNIIAVPAELQSTISQTIQKKIEPQPHIFDELQKEVEKIIEKEVYPAYLTSDNFIKYIQNCEDGAAAAEVTNTPPLPANSSGSSYSVASGSSSSTAVAMHSMVASTPDGADGAAATSFSRINDVTVHSPFINTSNLQTLHEDTELKLNAKSHSMKPRTVRPMPKLTEDLLLATQKGRLEVRPQGYVKLTLIIRTISITFLL